MSINTNIILEENLIIRTATGNITSDDIKSAFTESLSHPDFRPNMNVIWDFSDAVLSQFSAERINELVDFIRDSIDVRGATYKIALVASADLNFGLSRMLEGYGTNLSVSIGVVRTLESAQEWILKGNK